jgi:hypothetical protein
MKIYDVSNQEIRALTKVELEQVGGGDVPVSAFNTFTLKQVEGTLVSTWTPRS